MSSGEHRRSPLFAGILLILLGLIFLADRFYPHFGLGHLIRMFWPVLIILWGVAKLIDHRSAQRTGEPHEPLLSGAEAALLVLLALVLMTFVFRDWLRNEFPGIEIHLPGIGQSFSRTRSLPSETIPSGARVAVETARGDIKIAGTEGDQLRVSVRNSTTAGSGAAAGEKLGKINAMIERTGNGYRIHPADSVDQGGWRASATVDFDVQAPKAAPIDATTSHGDIEIRNTGADVSAASQNGDVKIAKVAGNVRVQGRGEDLDVADVTGDVTIDGDYRGDTHIRGISGSLRIKSAREELSVGRLTGELALDAGDLSVSSAGGPIKVTTRDKDVAIRGASGRLEIANSRGDIAVHFAKPPQEDINITSDSGDVELSLPAESSFQLAAVSRSGEVHCEFEGPAGQRADESEVERINGLFGTARPNVALPKVSIATSYGTIEIKKAK